MKHKPTFNWLVLFCCLSLLIGSSSIARANESHSSLMIQHTHSAVPIHIYHVAYKENDSYIKTDSFANLSIDFSQDSFPGDDTEYYASSSQSNLSSSMANTLYAYIRKEKIDPDYTKELDENGTGLLQGMKDGIYLLTSPPYETDSQTWYTNPVAVELNPQEHLQLSLKPSLYFSEVETLTIEKVWKSADGSPLSESNLPEIEAEIYEDGELYETVKLNASNHWKEELYLSNTAGHWTVIEKDIPEGYSLLVTQDNAQFTLTNTKKNTSSPNPEEPTDPGQKDPDPGNPDPKPDPKPDNQPKPVNPVDKSDGTISTGQASGFKLFVALGAVSLLTYRFMKRKR